MTDAELQQIFVLAQEHYRAGRLAEAESLYRQILASVDVPEVCAHLAAALLDQSKAAEAIPFLQQAIASRPDYAEAHNVLGNALRQVGRLEEATETYKRAIALNPHFADPHNNLASVLELLHRPNEAIAEYRRALALRPEYPEAAYNLGSALLARRELDEAIGWLRLAVRLWPTFGAALNNLAAALKEVGELDEAIDCYRRAIASSDDAGAASNLIYTLNWHPGYTAQQIKAEQDRWNERYARPVARVAPLPSRKQDGSRRLRIGYVSPDLRDHPAGRYIYPLLANHDHSRFEIFCYSDVREADTVTQKIRVCADVWRDTANLSDAQLAERIRQDSIDILVDLSMHMAGNRLLVFARKPAPVQITGLAYPAGTGLETIDFRFSDSYLDPPVISDDFYCERTIRLPGCYWCYVPLLPDLQFGPMDRGSTLTFGCLNTFSKVNSVTVDLWGQVLAAVPDSRLLVLAPEGSARQRLVAQLHGHGVAPSRIEFTGRKPRERYMELYRQIDIALDTYPCNGHTTTLDALWMGVPVVSLFGQTAVSRGSLSILSNLGLPELATDERSRYVQIAAALASDRTRLSELHSTLRSCMEASPVMHGPGFAKGVEATYRSIWEAVDRDNLGQL